jgi:hypothetical protein
MVELERLIMEYKISLHEIYRRKKAYFTLSISLVVGLILSSTILNFPVSIEGYLLTIAVIFLLGAFSFRFLHNLSQTKIYLSNKSLKRELKDVSEEYLLKNINHVKIKWTTNKTIREMYVWLNDEKSIFVSALDNFEQFKDNLLANIDKNVVVENVHEPLDFDHPLFYSILGLPISTLGVFIFKFVPSLDYQHIKTGEEIFSAFLFIFGVYFITTRPLSREYGNKAVVSDNIIGALMICLGLVFFYYFNFS